MMITLKQAGRPAMCGLFAAPASIAGKADKGITTGYGRFSSDLPNITHMRGYLTPPVQDAAIPTYVAAHAHDGREDGGHRSWGWEGPASSSAAAALAASSSPSPPSPEQHEPDPARSPSLEGASAPPTASGVAVSNGSRRISRRRKLVSKRCAADRLDRNRGRLEEKEKKKKTPSIEHVLARESLGIVLREKLVGLRLSKTGLSFVVENVSAEQERRFVATDRKPVARWARYHIRARREIDSRTG
ncbi:hypothetical protein K456DRAFT_1909504 [Colletotrichum gloeosporioides 23]|nr:hypothetical protein K456DRAFT_1909504 [Colletotrichum gloeosporioides 23]